MSSSPLFLPDSVWLHIFAFLEEDAFDLIALKESGLHPLDRVAKDKSLWKSVRVDNISKRSKSDFRKLIPHLGRHTKLLQLGLGNRTSEGELNVKKKRKKKTEFFSTSFLQSVKLRCPNLETLALEYTTFNALESPFICIPKSVRFLSLRGLSLENLPHERGRRNSPFLGLHKRLPLLEEIDLAETKSWLHKSDVAVCKEIKSLKAMIFQIQR